MLRYPVKLSKDTNHTILVDVPGIPEATHPAIKVRAITTAATAIALGRMVRPSEHRPRPRRSGGQTIAASCRAASHDGPIRLENASITAA